MAAIIGLDDARLPELLAAGAPHGSVTVANRNAPGQVVVSGDRAAVEAAVAVARDLGARRGILLPVSVAAHSSLMEDAARGMAAVLEPIAFADPAVPLLANADARPLRTGEACRAELVDHLTTGVDWIAAVTAMRDAGVTRFVEVGPGRVLSGLVRRIAPDAEIDLLERTTGLERKIAEALAAVAIESRRVHANGDLPGLIDTASLIEWARKCVEFEAHNATQVMDMARLTWADLVCGRTPDGRVDKGHFDALSDHLIALGKLPKA